MKRWLLLLLIGLFASGSSLPGGENAAAGESGAGKNYEILQITSETGVSRAAAFFHGESLEKVVVFVPGAVFDKESWFFLANRLQQRGVASLSLDGKQKQDVLASIEVMKNKGFKCITLVGGSMGGAAVLDALNERSDGSVSKVVLLAPAGGSPAKSGSIDKLFIVSKQDRLNLYGTARDLFDRSSGPKKFVSLEGGEHAQHIFKTGQREALIQLIIDFIVGHE